MFAGDFADWDAGLDPEDADDEVEDWDEVEVYEIEDLEN